MTKQEVTRFRKTTRQTWTGSASSTPPSPTDVFATGSQSLIISDSHAPLRLGRHDDGGPFHCLKHELDERNFGPTHNRTVVSSSDSNSFAKNYKGNYFAKFDSIGDAQFPLPILAQNSDLITMGTTAIARCIPTNPLVDLAVTLGEIKREGIPSLAFGRSFFERTQRAKNAGGDYLNYEFGWKPLVNDVLKAADATVDSDDVLQYYAANSGKLIRRRYSFPTQLTNSTTVDSSGTNARPVPAIEVGYWQTTGQLHTTTTSRQRTWFSGAFTYYLPPQGSLRYKNALLAKKYGHRLTPEVLWNLTPWTWAVDWFGNIGDVVHNISAFHNDGLVMPWAYIMQENMVQTQYLHSGAKTKRYGQEVNVQQTLRSIRKQRLKATPYGFGLNPAIDFSDRQWAILVALGLSKGNGQMKYD